jgi:hypothetical protein
MQIHQPTAFPMLLAQIKSVGREAGAKMTIKTPTTLAKIYVASMLLP